MVNEQIIKKVERMINNDQKDEILAANLHKQWVRAHNLVENFNILLKNEETIIKAPKIGATFKKALDEIKVGLKDINMSNISLEDIKEMEDLTKRCNIILKSTGYTIKSAVEKTKEPELTKINMTLNNQGKDRIVLENNQKKINCIEENIEILKNDLIVKSFKNSKNDNDNNIKDLTCALNDVGLKLVKSNDELFFEFKGSNIYAGLNKNKESTEKLSFSANKNVEDFNKLSIEQKEKYIMEAKLVKSILKEEVNRGELLTPQEVTKKVNEYYNTYLSNFNKEMAGKGDLFNEKIATNLVNSLKENLLSTQQPDIKIAIKEYLNEIDPTQSQASRSDMK